jgi:hypothetical protein
MSKKSSPAILAWPLSLLALWGLVSAFRTPQKEEHHEYRLVVDVEEDEISKMTKDGWEFAGYLGQSVVGDRVDETLWKRKAGR